jgi:methanogen homocitrate synthase
MTGKHITDLTWTSEYNYATAYRERLHLSNRVAIHDATLRDGEQTPGVVFSPEDKLEIAMLLDEIGVERIEAGMPAVSEADRKAIRMIMNANLKAHVFAFSRATHGDIDLAKECGVQGVIIETPTSEPKLKYQFPNWSEQDVIDKSIDAVKYAKSLGLETIYFGYDTTRADEGFLFRLYSDLLRQVTPDGIGMVDTMGCILPGAMFEIVRKLVKTFSVPIEVHTHNDFGMATATSFAAMEAGASVIHTCVNGLGERTGNAALEQILLGLNALYGMDTPYDLTKLCRASKRVSELSHIAVPVSQPVVGENIYVRESGLGVDLVMSQPLAMFATDPRITGNHAGVVLGKKSGYLSVQVKAKELGLDLNRETAETVLTDVKHLGMEKKALITDEEFHTILKGHGII